MTIPLRLFFVCLSLLLLSVFQAVPISASGESLGEVRHILLLNSYHQQMTWVKDLVQGVEDSLLPEENNLSLHIENMDSKVFFTPEYFEIFRQYLQVKYKDTQFSLILSSDNHAYDFLRQYRDKLFPGVPVSFCGVNDFSKEQLAGLDGFTGVAEKFSARATVEIALKNHPDTTELYIINDYLKTGRAWTRGIEADLRDIEALKNGVTIRYAANLTIEELQREIERLPATGLVLLGVYFSDKNSKYFTYERVGELISTASKVPVYCLLEFNISKGVVGGQVISGYSQGRDMARIGALILAGEEANSIPVKMEGSNRNIFNYIQLQRFAIDESLLPAGSHIINRPYSFYQHYKLQVWIVVAFIVALLGAIAALTANVRRRKRAEVALKGSEKRFRQLANATWEAIVVHDKGIFFHGNKPFYTMFGYTLSELEGRQVIPLIIDQASMGDVGERVKAGNLQPYEAVGCHKDGSRFPIEVRVREMEYEGRDVRMAAIRDLRGRKRLEERFAESQKLEAIGTLAGGIAHDFNNILSAIIGYCELSMLACEQGSKISRNLGEILKAGNRAKDLVQQILTFARQDSDEKEPVQVSLVVLEVLKLLRASLPTSITIEKEINTNCKVLSNTTKLHQILMNLCSNAGRAMKGGGVLMVTLDEIALSKEFVNLHSGVVVGKHIKLTVKDTGIGIPPEVMTKIFDPFL